MYSGILGLLMTFQIVRGCGTGDMVGIAEERPWRSDDYPALVMVWAWIDVLFFFDHNPKGKIINAIVKPGTELDREPAINYKCIELPIQRVEIDAQQVHALGNRPSTGVVIEGKLVNVWHGKKVKTSNWFLGWCSPLGLSRPGATNPPNRSLCNHVLSQFMVPFLA